MRCENCGFVFEQPESRMRLRYPEMINTAALEAAYNLIQVCPRCGSDAITEVRS